ncbi:MAG: glutamate decarboxylase [Planctomycetota bacterium]|nr:MAG: glutamate decarboxylase [Planctomycetota bacterium]
MTFEQKHLDQFYKIAGSYIDSLNHSDTLVRPKATSAELNEIFKFNIGSNLKEPNEIIDDLKKYLDFSTKTGHKNFYNQMFARSNLPALLGELTSVINNASAYTFEVAPVATLMELALIKKMSSLCGFENGGGQFVTGGSNANMVAMLCARNSLVKNSKELGLSNSKPLRVFVSEHSHYSFIKGVNVIGVGMDNLIRIPCDQLGKMKVELLEKEIIKSLAEDTIPFFVAGTSGTTVLNAFDPLEEIAAIANNYSLWFHVDGACGGSSLLSNKHKHLLDGVSLADSVTWDPHKMMSIPLICSVLLTKSSDALLKSNSSKHTEYLFHDDEEINIGESSLQCGRRADSLKLWTSWSYYGDAGYEKRIDRLFELAEHTRSYIEKSIVFDQTYVTSGITVCFQYIPDGITNADKINEFNRSLRVKMVDEGKTLINYSELDNNLFFRIAFLNPDISIDDVDETLQGLEMLGANLLKN